MNPKYNHYNDDPNYYKSGRGVSMEDKEIPTFTVLYYNRVINRLQEQVAWCIAHIQELHMSYQKPDKQETPILPKCDFQKAYFSTQIANQISSFQNYTQTLSSVELNPPQTYLPTEFYKDLKTKPPLASQKTLRRDIKVNTNNLNIAKSQLKSLREKLASLAKTDIRGLDIERKIEHQKQKCKDLKRKIKTHKLYSRLTKPNKKGAYHVSKPICIKIKYAA